MEKKNSNIINKNNLGIKLTTNSFFDCFSINNDNLHLLSINNLPKIIDGGGIYICMEGTFEIILNSKTYKIKKNDLFTIFPYSMIQIKKMSDDIKGYAFAVNTDFLANLKFASKTISYLYIKDNPCIPLQEAEITRIIAELEEVKKRRDNANNPYSEEISTCLLTAIFYEIASIYHKVKPIQNSAQSRQEQIFHNFNYILAKHYTKERQLDFYANELCISPKYLSTIVKTVTGIGASEWICNMVIIHAKSRLGTTTLTVQQIADELNFPNPSFFGQYFKRYTGITPNEYRKTILTSNEE